MQSDITIVAIIPLFEEWLESRHGVLTFRLSQVPIHWTRLFAKVPTIVGLGGRTRTDVPLCGWPGGHTVGKVEHMVKVCLAWARHRCVLDRRQRPLASSRIRS